MVFPSGPTVHGHIIRTSGSATSAASVEVGPIESAKDAAQSDLVDRTRFANADESGAFHIVISRPGKYRLHATWGSAAADRDFDIDDKDVDLGDVPLAGAASLRGSIANCRDGDAAVIAVPDLSKAPGPGFGNVQRGAIDTSGRFIVDGLTPGRWSVVIRCAGVITPASPEVVVVPRSGDVVIDFVIGAQEH